MVQRLKSISALALRLLVGMALLLAAPLLAAPPAATPTMVLQVGHTGMVSVIAWTPDGKTLVTGGFDDGTARLWDLATGQVKAVLPADEGTVALSADGQTLATVGGSGVQLWDVASGQLKLTLKGASGPLIFSPDSRALATGGVDDNGNPMAVRLWDPASGRLKAILPAGSVYTLAFSPDGQTLASGEDGEARLWDVGSGQLKATLETGFVGVEVEGLAFSADGGTLVTKSPDFDVTYLQFWDAASGKSRMGFEGAEWSFAFSPDGKTLATGGRDDNGNSAVLLWDMASGQLKATLQGHVAAALLVFSPDGQTLASAGSDDSGNPALLLLDAASGQLKASAHGQTDWVTSLAFAPDGQTLVTGDAVGTVRRWDAAGGKLTAILKGADPVDATALSPDGGALATGGIGGVRLWDVASGQLTATLHERTDTVSSLTFSPDGRTLASWSRDSATGVYTTQLWDLASRQLRATLQGPAGGVRYFAFSTDSRTLATGNYDSTTNAITGRLWDVASGQLRATLQVRGTLSGLAFSPDSQTLATASWDGAAVVSTVQLWDVASGRAKATLQPTMEDVYDLDFSPDGQTLATGGYTAVRLWDAASGRLRATLTVADTDGMLFSPDGRMLATGEGRLWDVASGELKATLRDAGRPLAFSTDAKTLATRDGSGKLQLWEVATARPIVITAQTSLAQFPPWVARPFSSPNGRPEVSLLDPFDEHVLATLQVLPAAPASLFAPPPDPATAPPAGGNWITTTPDGYLEGSANLASFIRWNVDRVLYPASAYWDVYYRPDLVRQALSGGQSPAP